MLWETHHKVISSVQKQICNTVSRENPIEITVFLSKTFSSVLGNYYRIN
jgi:hypothetical protein